MSGGRVLLVGLGAALLLAPAGGVESSLPLAGVVSDADSNWYYVPDSVGETRVPGLVVLHCNGAGRADLDSVRIVADSLGWALAACRASRNHRDIALNDADVVKTIRKFTGDFPVDSRRVFVFGFSGQGVQALATMFAHPELVRGVMSVCGHRGAVELADWTVLGRNLAYLVTREEDWNRAENEIMLRLFNSQGLLTELVMTPGEHGTGNPPELLAGCRWLDRQSSGRQ